MTYEVIKTINGHQYRYKQETYRENGRVKTRNVYIGPVDGGRRRKKGIAGVIDDLLGKREKNVETEAEIQARVAREDVERAQQDHVNDLLIADTISLDTINEIAEAQATAESAPNAESEAAPGEAGKGAGAADGGTGSDGDQGSA